MTENGIASSFAKKGDGPPPVDIPVLAIGFVGAAGCAFVLAFLVQFAGPVVEDGPSPQAIAGVTYVAAGLACWDSPSRSTGGVRSAGTAGSSPERSRRA